MTTRLVFLTLSVAIVAGCGAEPEVPAETVMTPVQVLPNVAIPPGGEAIGSEGGTEAASLLISTPVPADSVVEFYRDVLSKPPYRLINESVTGARTSFYAEQEGPPLWVTVESLEAGGTLVRLSGAAIKTDSTAAPAVPPT